MGSEACYRKSTENIDDGNFNTSCHQRYLAVSLYKRANVCTAMPNGIFSVQRNPFYSGCTHDKKIAIAIFQSPKEDFDTHARLENGFTLRMYVCHDMGYHEAHRQRRRLKQCNHLHNSFFIGGCMLCIWVARLIPDLIAQLFAHLTTRSLCMVCIPSIPKSGVATWYLTHPSKAGSPDCKCMCQIVHTMKWFWVNCLCLPFSRPLVKTSAISKSTRNFIQTRRDPWQCNLRLCDMTSNRYA